MFLVIIALLPATIFGIYNFGIRALVHVFVTVAASVLTEYVFEKGMKRPITIKDGSAALTGLLLALNLPSTAPWWIGLIGGVFAILVVKQLFGGLGQNFMNPALGARCFLLISFTSIMTNFPQIGNSSATPLAALKAGEAVNTRDMLLGFTSGTIGETSAIALLIGAIILLWFGVIDIVIPGLYILTFVIFISLFGGHPSKLFAHGVLLLLSCLLHLLLHLLELFAQLLLQLLHVFHALLALTRLWHGTRHGHSHSFHAVFHVFQRLGQHQC